MRLARRLVAERLSLLNRSVRELEVSVIGKSSTKGAYYIFCLIVTIRWRGKRRLESAPA